VAATVPAAASAARSGVRAVMRGPLLVPESL